MRIVAGKFRRRKLLTRSGLTTRPITDRVKVILFDRLQGLLEETRVLDLFAGTGSLGLEALSRGASSVVFIEQDRQAHQLLVENVRILQAESQTLCWRTDALRSSFRPKGVPDFLPFDLVFFDPPYRMAGEIRPGEPIYDSLERLARTEVTVPETLLVLRCARFAEFELPPSWSVESKLVLNSMALHFCRKGTPCDPSGD